MMQINIAFCNRPSYDNPLGGDAIQMLKTKEWLESLYGFHISLITDPKELTDDFDIVHIFNFATYEITDRFMEKAHQLGIPIVSSCIYWDYSYSIPPLHYFLSYPSHIRKSCVLFYRFLYRSITALLRRPKTVSWEFRKYVRKFIDYSSFVLPNSLEEGILLYDFARMKNMDKLRVVYNGVELKENQILSPEIFFSKYKLPRNYILQVGRIEYLKNQLNLIYALRNHSEIPIVFIGQISNVKYGQKLHAIARERGNVIFLDKVPHDEIASFYHYANLHVLLSLRESPGLVSMEAAAQGCPIVISTSDYLPKETYFPKAPYVVDPLDISAIEQTLLQAYQERKVFDLNINDFSWSNVAVQTCKVYEEVMINKNVLNP